jgi:predicted dehydrogenase
MTKLAIIGAGYIAGLQVKAFRMAGFDVISAASSKDSKTIHEFCRFHNIKKIILDPIELFESDEWDALYLSVPTEKALSYLKNIEDNKRPILVEKPISFSSKEIGRLVNLNNIKVAYNRRFYDGVKYIKNYFKNKKDILVKVCIPESSFKIINTNNTSLLPPLTFENSVHIFDLINYICGNTVWNYKKVIRETDSQEVKFIVANGKSDREHRIILDIYYDSPANFSMEFQSKEDCIILKPIELMNHYRGLEIIEPTIEIPLRLYYPKKINSVIEINKDGIKPGLQEQAHAFYRYCVYGESNELATLADAASAILAVESLIQ